MVLFSILEDLIMLFDSANSLFEIGNLTAAGSTAGVRPSTIKGNFNTMNVYIVGALGTTPSPVFTFQFSPDGSDWFDFVDSTGTTIQSTALGMITNFPRVNTDILMRFTASGSLGTGSPSVNAFIG